MSSKRTWILAGLLAVFAPGCNPFAPAYDEEGLGGQELLGDRTTIDGLFEYFKNAYEIRDTSLYGKLFSPDFTFVYYDFDQNAEVSWDKGTEMVSTFNLFRSVQQITLDWNYFIEKSVSGDTAANVVRTFNLNIVESESNIFTGTGRARLRLRRTAPTEPWLITYWFDDSDF